MSISQYTALNTTALITPDLHVIIVPPSQLTIKGVSSNIAAVIGTASWGPVNQPSIVSSMSDYAAGFGPVMARKHDMGTHVATAALQGANNFRCVRVTDGTDTVATAVLPTPDLTAAPAFWAAVARAVNSGAGVQRNASSLVTFDAGTGTFSAIYSGSLGDAVTATVSKGSKAGTYRLVVGLHGSRPEVFDNLPSTVGATPTLATYTLAGGTDGADVDSSHLIGLDVSPRTGMYALRSQNQVVSLLDIADCDDTTTFTTQAAFALSEQMYAICVTPAGDTIANAVAVKATSGLDAWPVKVMFGDWLWFNDAANDLVRLVSPQGFVLGRLANLSPEQSSLNKPLFGIVGSQKSGQPGGIAQSTYATADTDELIGAGIDLICNPVPYGNVWAVRGGCNSSSDSSINGDEYTRMTNFFARSVNAAEGKHVGATINIGLLNAVRYELIGFCSQCLAQGILGTVDGSLPYAVQCDPSNNPQIATGQGYTQAYMQVRYQGINKNFLINLQAGATQVISQSR